MEEKISIIGAGSWGTTLAIIFARKGITVELYSVFGEHNYAMQRDGENRLFLKGQIFPSGLVINPSLIDTLKNKILILAVPVQYMRAILKKIRQIKLPSLKGKVFVSVAKGIEEKTLHRPSQIILEELGNVKNAVLSGPTIAHEVVVGVPTTCVLASHSKGLVTQLQKVFSTNVFRVYSHDDVIGVELGGALKNVVAIACGISDGLGFGTNTKAALVTRGLVEIARLGEVMGARVSTFSGISGLGDLVTTCFSPYSRNRFVGEEIGKGKRVKEIIPKMKMVAEGVTTAKSGFKLAKKMNVDMPITQEVYYVLYKNKSPKCAVPDLMKRPLKAEGIH